MTGRGQSQVALNEAGLSPEDADAYLDVIDRETGFLPPFWQRPRKRRWQHDSGD